MMSSSDGFTAEVIATESPSQERPTVTQRTWASIASVAAWFGANSIDAISAPLSTDAGQRVAHELVHDPLAAERRLHQDHPGGLRLDLSDYCGLLAPRRAAQGFQRGVRLVGCDHRHQHALVRDVHRVDSQ